MESVERACETVSLFMIKHRHELKLSPKMSEREWMHFDNIFKQLIYDLRLIADYNHQLFVLRDSASLEQLDVAMLTEHVELEAKAKAAWNYWLDQHTRVFNTENRSAMHDYISMVEHDNVDAYTHQLKSMLPVSAITSLSARRRLPFKEAVYDLLIIDEASQCDIASMVPLMMRAKRIAVIGDKQQLSHICLLNKQTDLSLINKHEIEARWSYRGSSI